MTGRPFACPAVGTERAHAFPPIIFMTKWNPKPRIWLPSCAAGATSQERRSWADVVEMYHRGELAPDDQVMLPGKEDWVRLADTPLSRESARDAGHNSAPERPATPERSAPQQENDSEASLSQESAAREYADLAEKMRGGSVTIEMLIEAGDLAAESGDKEAARTHFQEALDMEPFHGRTRQAIRRRFTPSERKEFRNVERPEAVWDDIGSLLSFPFARGPVYAAVPAGVIFLLSFIPGGGFAVGMLLFLWGYQVVGHVVRGGDSPPLWHRAQSDPLHEIFLPLGAALCVVIEYAAVFAGLAQVGVMLEGKSVGLVEFISHSPFMLITIFITLIASLPAVVTLIAFRDNPFAAALPNNVVRTAVALGSEYALNLFLILVLAFPIAILKILIGDVPVVGNLIVAVLLAVVTPMVGMMLATMLARNEHSLERLR